MSQHVALSFLGLSDYETTTYKWEEDTCTTKFMQEAVQEFFTPDQLFVAMTPSVRDKHDAALSGRDRKRSGQRHCLFYRRRR